MQAFENFVVLIDGISSRRLALDRFRALIDFSEQP